MFFTIYESEVDDLLNNQPNYNYEGIAGYVYATNDNYTGEGGLAPIHRVWLGEHLQDHFYGCPEWTAGPNSNVANESYGNYQLPVGYGILPQANLHWLSI